MEEESFDGTVDEESFDGTVDAEKYQANRWKLWHLYNELDHCPRDRVTTLRTAIAYLGGRLDYRYPVPRAIAREGGSVIPVRQPTPKPRLRRQLTIFEALGQPAPAADSLASTSAPLG